MDPFHERLTRIALEVAAGHGFVLAGGYAVAAHGIVTRISDDVDLFTNQAGGPRKARDAVADAYRADGIAVSLDMRVDNEDFARLLVTDEEGQHSKVELGRDWRAHQPVILDVGPVLHPDDAVAAKTTALFGRALPRDFIDVDAAVLAGYSRDRLIDLATERDPGFNRPMFAVMLRTLDTISDKPFALYGRGPDEVAGLRVRFREWREELEGTR
ncbi:MAG: nucleotidyl transferase AbiEii/AbiGii toxin family protein [Mycobacteriales bacterium]